MDLKGGVLLVLVQEVQGFADEAPVWLLQLREVFQKLIGKNEGGEHFVPDGLKTIGERGLDLPRGNLLPGGAEASQVVRCIGPTVFWIDVVDWAQPEGVTLNDDLESGRLMQLETTPQRDGNRQLSACAQ